MNKIIRGAALTLAAVTLFTTTAFAASIPVRQTFEDAGFTVTWDQATLTVTVSKDGFSASESVGDNIVLTGSRTYASEEFINSIYADYQKEMLSTKATVKEIGEGYFLADTEKLGEVIFMFDDTTIFRHEMNRRRYMAADLTVGANLKVYFGETMTSYIHPKPLAVEVVFLKEAQLGVEMGNVTTDALVQTFTVSETGEGYIMGVNETLGEVMFLVDENTTVRHEKNRRRYFISDIKAGMTLVISYSDASTLSLPPQTLAKDIIITEAEEAEAEKLVKAGTITEKGESYFVITFEDGEYQFNVTDETIFRHAKNKMLYKFDVIEEGMNVEVTHSEEATLSLPPQSIALEVVITK